MTLIQWVYAVLGEIPSEYEFVVFLTASILLVIGFVCVLSLFIGIAFAIFKR